MSDKEISSQFKTETIKLFTDILYIDGKFVLMVKSWQKINFNCKLKTSTKAHNFKNLINLKK